MALNPSYAAQAVLAGSSAPPPIPHTLELFLDYVCPYSAKMWRTLSTSVFPSVGSTHAGRVRFILRQQIQPWHPSSTLTHEAAAAVLRLSPDKFIAFSTALFEKQTEYFDVNVVNETRNNTYVRLAKLAASVGVDEAKVYNMLKISDKPGEGGALNTGNGVTADIKVMTKTNRLMGVHVTPTVLFNGVVENAIASSFTGEQWQEWLAKNIV